MSDAPTRVVPVEVFGQQFPIRSDLDEAYIHALADFVNERIRAAAVVTPSTDSLRVAVLAALNIADEYFRAREAALVFPRAVSEQLGRLERIIDDALGLPSGSAAPGPGSSGAAPRWPPVSSGSKPDSAPAVALPDEPLDPRGGTA